MLQGAEAIEVLTLVAGIGGPVLAAGGAFFAVKFGLNGARQDIGEIKRDVKELADCQHRSEIQVTELAVGLKDTRQWVGAVEQRLERHCELNE